MFRSFLGSSLSLPKSHVIREGSCIVAQEIIAPAYKVGPVTSCSWGYIQYIYICNLLNIYIYNHA